MYMYSWVYASTSMLNMNTVSKKLLCGKQFFYLFFLILVLSLDSICLPEPFLKSDKFVADLFSIWSC